MESWFMSVGAGADNFGVPFLCLFLRATPGAFSAVRVRTTRLQEQPQQRRVLIAQPTHSPARSGSIGMAT